MTVLAVNFQRLSPYTGSNTDVDVVLDLMIHDLDLVMDLVGAEPVTLEARGLAAFSGAIDHAQVTVQFERGPLLSVTASRVTEQKVRKIEATALEAYVDGDLLNKAVSVHRSMIGEYLSQNHRGVKYRQESVVERIHVPSAEPLFLELQHFVDCVRHHTPPLVTAEHGLRALRLAMRIRQSIHSRLLQTEHTNGVGLSNGHFKLPVPVARNGMAAATGL
jgi:predicted dehydrogenase